MLHLCQREPYQREATCRVVSCEPQDEAFLVKLEDSLLYPEGGGQPADFGTIAGIAVRDTQKADTGVVICRCDAAVPLGDASVIVDWARRYDHMQQHSAQHLITAIANERLGFATVGFHLGEEYAAIELDTPDITDAALAQLLEWTNEAIREARPITWRMIAPEQMAAEGIRSRLLPEGFTGDLRIVEIEGIDQNTCGGTHVASTAELQMVAFLGTERIRKRVRLSFVAGGRMQRRFQAQLTREKHLTQAFNQPPEAHIAMVDKQSESLQAAQQYSRQLEIELAHTLGQSLAAQDTAVRALLRPGASRQFLEDIAMSAQQAAPEAFVLLGSTNDANRLTGEGIFLLKGPDPSKVKAIGQQIAAILEGKGGGKPGVFQGKASRMEAWDEALALCLSHI